MLQAFSKASAFLFYVLGSATIVLYVLSKRGMFAGYTGIVANVIDLPLLFVGMVFAGTGLYGSLTRGGERTSVPLMIAITLPLLLIFCLLAYFNFGFPIKVIE